MQGKRYTDFMCDKCSSKVFIVLHEDSCAEEYACLCRRSYLRHRCVEIIRKEGSEEFKIENLEQERNKFKHRLESLELEFNQYKECHPENKKIFDHMIDMGKRYASVSSQAKHQSFIIERLENEVDKLKDKVKNMDLIYLRHRMECECEPPFPWDNKLDLEEVKDEPNNL